ncbi:hypothetical protein KJQ78_01960 [Campylobacter lari]|uniref:hypothetical protein n=1 Tax=Campylobacter lari TaxID=201 RepID=UPI0012726A7C|nr:hypothetical protein [Campylobacter lari]MBT0824028.1 hypothetical protein [Campylobacter lari]
MNDKYRWHRKTLSVKSRTIKAGLKNNLKVQTLLCQGIMCDWDYIVKCCKLTNRGDIYDFLSACFNVEKEIIKSICNKLKDFKNDPNSLNDCCNKKIDN